MLKLMSIERMIPSNHPILCHPFLLLPSTISSIRVFSSELTLPIGWPKYWSFSFSISPSNEYLGLISFRIDWFDPCYPRDTQSLFQHHSLKVSILHCSAFFTVQLSYLYMTTGKTIALTIQTFVDKVMTLLFNKLSRFAISFPGGSGKESACNVEDLGLIPGLERSPGAGHDNPLQYFCLENPHG